MSVNRVSFIPFSIDSFRARDFREQQKNKTGRDISILVFLALRSRRIRSCCPFFSKKVWTKCFDLSQVNAFGMRTNGMMNKELKSPCLFITKPVD